MSRIRSQKDRVEGAPFGTRGGISVVHNFPADGKYVFHIMPYNAVEGEVFGRTFGEEQIEIAIDGERVALLTIDRWMRESEPTGLNIRTDSIQVSAGPHEVSAAFIRQFEGELDDLIRPIDHTLADGQIGIGYGVDHAAAPSADDDPRTVRGDGRLGHADAPLRLQLPADRPRRGASLR